MNGTYKRFDQINPDLFRSMIMGDRDETPTQEQSGLMSPTLSLSGMPSTIPQPRPDGLGPRFVDTSGALEQSILGTVAANIGNSATDRERVANAVVPRQQMQEADLTEWETMPPLQQTLQGDATRAALGSAPSMPSSPTPDPVNVEGSTRGATPVSQQQENGTWNSTNFADTILRRFEGTEAHASLEGGADTGAFGVKFSRGLNREDYDSDLAFAAAVAQEHYNDVSSSFSSQGRNLSSLPVSVQNALVDLNYNTGSIGSTAEKETPLDMMRNTLDFVGATTADGTRGSLLSLARRRAENWNAAANDIGAARIASVEQVPTSDGGTTFRYLDADGNAVHTTNTSRQPITFTGGTSYRVNTQTRRVEID